jgi:hypothetical protein
MAAFSSLYTGGRAPAGVNPGYLTNLTLGLNSFITWANQQPSSQVIVLVFEEIDAPIVSIVGPSPGNATLLTYVINAFRYISQQVHSRTSNVRMCWAPFGQYWPTAQGFAGLYNSTDPNHLTEWYPGDDVVDWIGTSVFLVNVSYQIQGLYPAQITRPLIYEFARAHNKPVMFTELYPVSLYSDPADNNGNPFIFVFQSQVCCSYTPAIFNTTIQDIQQYYVEALFAEIRANADVVRMFDIFNSGSDNPPSPSNPSGFAIGFGALQIESNPYLRPFILAELRNPAYYFQMPTPGNSAFLVTGVADVTDSEVSAPSRPTDWLVQLYGH